MKSGAYLCRSETDPQALQLRGLLARVELGEPVEKVFEDTNYPYFFWRLYANFVKWLDSDFDVVSLSVIAAQAANDLKIRGIDETL